MLFNAKAVHVKSKKLYYLTHSFGDKGVHIFVGGVGLKVNVQARLEFGLTSRLQSSTLSIIPREPLLGLSFKFSSK